MKNTRAIWVFFNKIQSVKAKHFKTRQNHYMQSRVANYIPSLFSTLRQSSYKCWTRKLGAYRAEIRAMSSSDFNALCCNVSNSTDKSETRRADKKSKWDVLSKSGEQKPKEGKEIYELRLLHPHHQYIHPTQAVLLLTIVDWESNTLSFLVIDVNVVDLCTKISYHQVQWSAFLFHHFNLLENLFIKFNFLFFQIQIFTIVLTENRLNEKLDRVVDMK